MSYDVDDDLRRLFDKSASTIGTISPGFTDTVLTEGARRRRIRRVTAAGGAAAAVLLVSGALWQVPDLVDNSSPIQPANPSGVTSIATPEVETRFASPGEWAASLPRGENVQAAFAARQTLHAGDLSVPITGPDVKPSSLITVHGPTADGWLATVSNLVERALRHQIGIVAPDGSFTPIFSFSGLGASQALVSPDGTQFAVGADIRDTETGALETSLPHRNDFAAAWLDEGMVYVSTAMKASNTRMWLWQPGSEPVRIAEIAVVSANGIAVTTEGNCAAAGPLSQPPSTYQQFCPGGAIVSMSPNGERVFTESFEVVDVATGEATPLPVPEFDRPRMSYYSLLILTTFWEDEDHLVMLIPGEDQAAYSFVRCEISTNTCERASKEVHGANAPFELSPLD